MSNLVSSRSWVQIPAGACFYIENKLVIAKMEIFNFAIIAFFMGIKHAFDADHVLLVTNILSKSKKLKESLNISLSWGIGHMITAGIITTLIFYNVNSNPVRILLENIEVIIPVTLISIGIISLTVGIPVQHKHEHEHEDGSKHEHIHTHRIGGMLNRNISSHHTSFGVGIIHGLASNDELFIVLVLGLGLGSIGTLIGGIILFSLGVICGMISFSMMLFRSMNYFTRNIKLTIHYGLGIISIIYGLYLFEFEILTMLVNYLF